MLWNPAVLAGVGVVDDHTQLYKRMHSYLQASGIDGVKVRWCCDAPRSAVGLHRTLEAPFVALLLHSSSSSCSKLGSNEVAHRTASHYNG